MSLDHQTKLCSQLSFSLSSRDCCFHFPAKWEILAQSPKNCLKSARRASGHPPPPLAMMESFHSSGIPTVETGGVGDGMIPLRVFLLLGSQFFIPKVSCHRVRTETWPSPPKNPFKKLSNDSASQKSSGTSPFLSQASLARVKREDGVRGARWW